jgi:TonB family protein
LTKDSGTIAPAPSLALGIDDYRLAVDPFARVLEAPGGVMRMAQSRPIFAAVLAGSLALHLLGLFILNRLEQAPPVRPDVGVEIPVELVSDPDPIKKGKAEKGDKGQQSAAKGAQANKAAKSATKPQAEAARPPQPEKPKDSTAAAQKPPPQQPAAKSAVAESKAAASPAKPGEPAKPAAPAKFEPPKQMAQPEPPKPTAEPPRPAPPVEPSKSAPSPPAEPPKPAPAPVQQAAQPPKPAPAVNPAVMAGLQPLLATPAAGGQSPYGLMPDNWQAVAVPAPSEDGDEDLSYKTVVFSKLELAKQFPQDARARGARGSALIKFDLNDDGTVKSVKLLRSSGDTELDVESLAVVERAAPFPKPPPGAQKSFAAAIEFDPSQP